MRKAKATQPTKENLMSAAQRLMMAKGYEATSIEEICSQADAAKGSFFHYFKNKEDLGKALIDRFSECMRDQLCCSQAKAGQDPLDRVYALIDYLIKGADSADMKGCLVGTIVQEVHQTHPEIRSECCKRFDASVDTFASDLAEAKRKYAHKASFKPKEVAELFISLMQGSFILMRARRNRKIVKTNLKLYRQYLQGLFGKG